MEYIIFIHNSWSPKHLFPTDGVHNIQSQEMESKAVTHERWSQQRLLTTYGVNVDFYFPSSSPIIHNTYKGEKESTAFTRYGVHNIDSQDMEHTAFSLVRWNTQYILTRHAFTVSSERHRQSGVNEIAQALKWQRWFRTPVPSTESPTLYHTTTMSH